MLLHPEDDEISTKISLREELEPLSLHVFSSYVSLSAAGHHLIS